MHDDTRDELNAHTRNARHDNGQLTVENGQFWTISCLELSTVNCPLSVESYAFVRSQAEIESDVALVDLIDLCFRVKS